MLSHSLYIRLLLIASSLTTGASLVAARQTAVVGVPPSKAKLYQPTSQNTWKCLDGSKEIPFSSVNDDYCDCVDGSDEPGTSACANGTFYCANSGHIGASISSSRVRDGLCEPECCDGSDEEPGVCPNQCESIGKAYREKQEALNKIRRTGAKIRSTYVSFAQKEKTRLEASIASLKKELREKEQVVKKAKEQLEHTELLDAAALSQRKQSPLYAHLTSSKHMLTVLTDQLDQLKERVSVLEGLLDNLETGHNPNYVDMAVIGTVKEWKSMKGVKEAEEAEAEEDPKPSKLSDEETSEPEITDEWVAEQTERLEKTDLVQLLLDHERHVGGDAKTKEDVDSLLFSVEDYLPDSMIPSYEYFKDLIVGVLSKTGIIPKSTTSTSDEAVKARSAFDQAEKQQKETSNKLEQEEEALRKLFAEDGFGKEGEWKKLDGKCFSKDTGEYTYSVCMFGAATQKANKGGGTHNLGNFASWSTNHPVGSEGYYQEQKYTRGARCWNGPERSVTLALTCGVENEILDVTEPEKCEYRFTGTSPALCKPVAEPPIAKDEL